MAVNSTYLGAARVSGPEAEAFARKVAHGRGRRAATVSASNGRALTQTFAKHGVVKFSLKKPTASK